MGLTVREMLEMPALNGMKVLAGHDGIDKRCVQTVTVMDAPDIGRWLHGGEFLLSTCYIVKDNPRGLMKMIEEFNGLGVAALGIKIDRFLKELSPEVVHLADMLEFPLLDVPIYYAFSDVINPVLSRVVNRQAQRLRYSETVRRSFFDLITAGGGVNEVLSNLDNFLHEDFAFIDVVFGENYLEHASEEFRARIAADSVREVLEDVPYEIIATDNKVYGYLLFNTVKKRLNEKDYEIPITQARMALLLSLQKQIARTEAERRYRDEFIQDILFNNLRFEKEVWNRGRMFGWRLHGPHIVVVIDIDNYKHHFESVDRNDREILSTLENVKKRIYKICTRWIHSVFPDTPYTEMSDSIAYIVPVPEHMGMQELKIQLLSCLQSLQEDVGRMTHFTTTVGVGNLRDSVLLSYESFDEARKAIETVRSASGGGHLIFWKDLGIYKLLGNLYNTPDAINFFSEYLGPLIEHDRCKKTQFLSTLKAIARNNWQLKAAARDLSLHYNTLKYRYRKICGLLEFDPMDSEHRLNVALSLKLYLMNQNLDQY